MGHLAIKGHATLGKEVIKILEMMGGINELALNGTQIDSYYYIDNIDSKIHLGLSIYPYDYTIYTLEEFLEKFPYKVGDRVLYKIYGIYSKIKSMLWNVEKEQVFYRLCSNKLFVATADELKSRKEETMEEINIDRIGFNGNKAKLILPDGYEFKTEGKDAYIIKKKPQYQKTYEECCEAIGINRYDIEIDLPQTYQQKMFNLFKLLICRDAYWKIAGDWKEKRKEKTIHHVLYSTPLGEVVKATIPNCIGNYQLDFPTEEMRDIFYENFKELIENCKELL